MSIRLYWIVPATGTPKSPKKISDTWPELPANIDTAFQDPKSKKIFFFSGNYTFLHTAQLEFLKNICESDSSALVIKQCNILIHIYCIV